MWNLIKLPENNPRDYLRYGKRSSTGHKQKKLLIIKENRDIVNYIKSNNLSLYKTKTPKKTKQ